MSEKLKSLGVFVIKKNRWPSKLRADLDEALLNVIGEDNLRLWLNERPVTLVFGGAGTLKAGHYHALTSGSKITFSANGTTNPVINILHEFGHVVDNLWDDFFTKKLERVTFLRNGNFSGGWNGTRYLGLKSDFVRQKVLKQARVGGGDAWQQRGGTAHWEDWADIFSNAMLENIKAGNQVGRQILDFVGGMKAHVMPPAAA
jgi:hypothetical protein